MIWNIIRGAIVVFLFYIISALFGIIEAPSLSRIWKEPVWQNMAALPEARSVGGARVITEEDTTPHFLSMEIEDTPYLMIFYGDWCGVCRRKLPYFIEKAQAFADAGAPILLVGDRRSRPGAWKEWLSPETNIDAVTAVIDVDRTMYSAAEFRGVPSYSILNSAHEMTATFYV